MPEVTFSLEDAYGSRGDPGAQEAARLAMQNSDQIRIRERELADPKISHEDKIAIGKDLQRIRATGKVPEPPRTTFSLEEAYGPRSETDIRAGGAKAATRSLAREVADFGDMILSIPGMAVGTVGDFGVRIDSLLRGRSPAETGQLAQTTRRDLTQQYSPHLPSGIPLIRGLVEKAISAVSPDDQEVDPTSVEKGMALITEGVEKGGGWIEKRTGGKIKSADFDSVVSQIMALGGLRGAAAPLKPKGEVARQTQTATQRQLEKQAGGVRGPVVEEAPRVEPPKEEGAPPPSPDVPPTEVVSPAKVTGEVKIREGRAFDLTPEERIATRGSGVKPNAALVSALEKTAAGRGFDLTMEEKAALRGWGQEKARQGGAVDRDLLNVLAVGGAGAALALAYPEEAQDAALASLAGGAILTGDLRRMAERPASSSLAAMLAESGTTLKTLERLPQNRIEFPRQMVEEQLRRPDVTKAEKEALAAVLAEVPQGGKISAKDLVLGFKKATGDFELRRKETQTYADYGLENIDRLEADPAEVRAAEMEGADVAELRRVGGMPARTVLYRVPERLDLGKANHFNDPQYFGHTRSFDEGGVRHVVEVQSDYAQKARKPLSVEETRVLRGEQAGLEADYAYLEKAWTSGDWSSNPEAVKIAKKHVSGVNEWSAATALSRIKARIAEHKIKLAENTKVEGLSPMLKNWPKRLVREELAAAAARGEPTVRFATADTMAKVEGWPDQQAAYERTYRGSGEERAGLVSPPKARFKPEHQSIYDRYRGDIEKFLRQLGAQPHTDSAGHTWLEVPTRAGESAAARRAQMFGGATERALATLAGISVGALAGSYFASDKPTGALIGASLAAGGALLAAKSPAVRNAAASTLNVADKTLGLISTRVLNMSPRLARAWSDLEYHTIANAYQALEAVHPFINAMNKLPRAERSRARALWQASDVAGWQAFLQSHPDVAKEWPRTANVIQVQNLELASRGMHSAYQHGAFPQFGTDPKASPAETLATFIRSATAEVQKADFFGSSAKPNKQGTSLNLRRSIAQFTQDAQATYGISAEQARELGDMLTARFGPGERGGNKLLQDVKNATYTALLANPVSATVQLTDVPIQIAVRGLGPTLEGVARTLTGKKNFSIREMGLMNHIAEEYAGERTSTRAMKKAFQLGLFTAMDTFSKNVVVNSAFAELRNLAKKNPQALASRFDKSLGAGDAAQLISDLNSGTKSDLVRSVIFSELSRSQPVSRFELPEAYLNHPNGRVLWMLKTYAIKQADLFRRDAYNKIKEGKTAEGLGNLARLSAAFMAAGASQDWIRDWLLGRGFDPKATDLPAGLLQTMGLSPYLGDKLKQGKLKEALVGATLPPVSMLDDVVNGRERSVQYIPLVGKLYYAHGMGGAERWKAGARRREEREAREAGLSPDEKAERKRRREERRRLLDQLKAQEYRGSR